MNKTSGVVANKQKLERFKISVLYYFQNVSIKTQLHNLRLWEKMFGIHMIFLLYVFNLNYLFMYCMSFKLLVYVHVLYVFLLLCMF